MVDPRLHLEREEDWYKIYSSADHPRIYISKFATGEAHISLHALLDRWPQWNEGERVQFAQAFGQKHRLDEQDERIVAFLMEQESPLVMSAIALASTKHPDTSKVVRFLLQGTATFPTERANFLHALSVLAAPESAPAISQIYEDSEREISSHPQNHEAAVCLLYAASALFRIGHEEKYRDKVAAFLQNHNENLRAAASLCLREIET